MALLRISFAVSALLSVHRPAQARGAGPPGAGCAGRWPARRRLPPAGLTLFPSSPLHLKHSSRDWTKGAVSQAKASTKLLPQMLPPAQGCHFIPQRQVVPSGAPGPGTGGQPAEGRSTHERVRMHLAESRMSHTLM